MRILLLSNQPERTTRLLMFKTTLHSQGHEVIVPKFSSRGWLQIAKQARQVLQNERPDAVHLFNVPDIIFHGLGKLKGSFYKKLIYDYRSPWGVELQMSFGPLARLAGEFFERELAGAADLITAVNRPLADKVRAYAQANDKPLFIVNNYPERSFLEKSRTAATSDLANERPIVFMGRISRQEGIGNLLHLIRKIPEQTFWIIGDGPFSRWYLRKLPKNARFFGWQPHDKVAGLISQARICLIPHSKSLLTPYATDKSVWKLNEYLLLGKTVVASGVTEEEKRKNLVVVKAGRLEEAVRENLMRDPQKLSAEDYRFWDRNDRIIREAYESL
ncbi:MAG: glycosyl transferase family 1 [Methanotrichaceae archaeon]|nr:glycosyl transferase family 1 [Methanotrichaceae archaeon]